MIRSKTKFSIFRWTALWILGVLCFASVAFAQPSSEMIHDYMQKVLHEFGAPGLSVAVGLNGHMVFSGGVGYAELDNRTPATARTVHNIASVSKTHAAVAIMQLVEQGKVNLDAEIQEYVPYFPKKRWPVTVRQIMTHTSGIRHYRRNDFGPQRWMEKVHYDSLEAGIKFFKDDTLLYQPGTTWLYSSYAINLLQGIVEDVTGIGFEAYLRKYVWEPAGMLSTQFDKPDRIIHNRGRGYVRNRRGLLVNIEYSDVSYKYAGGGILSTAEDLVRFGMALNDGTLLKPATMRAMVGVQVDPVMRYQESGEYTAQDHRQALVWFIRTDAQGRTFPSHTGTVKGCRTYLCIYPDVDLVVALTTNIVPFDPVQVGNAVAQLYLPAVHLPVKTKK